MDLVDIQPAKENFELTFEGLDGIDALKITVKKDDMWQIAKYCQNELSYGAQLKKKRNFRKKLRDLGPLK